MPEPTLIQEQRAILRYLRQTTAHHIQITTAANAQWQEVQRAYEEARARLAEIGEEQALRSAPTSPPNALPGVDPAKAFQRDASRVLEAADNLRFLLQEVPADWRQIATWEAHGKGTLGLVAVVGKLAFSPDSRLLASLAADRTVRVWDLSSWQLLHVFQWHIPQIGADMHFAPDGRLLLALRDRKIIQVLEVMSGHLLQTFKEEDWVEGASFFKDGLVLVSVIGNPPKMLKCWEIQSGQVLFNLTFNPKDGVSIMSSDCRIRALLRGGVIKISEVESGHLLQTMGKSGDKVLSAWFSLDSRLLAIGYKDKT